MRTDNLLKPSTKRLSGKQIDLSVVIPCFMKEDTDVKYLRRCLRSISIQERIPSQVILSDNSEDSSRVKSLMSEFPDLGITYIHNITAKGIGANSNVGAESAICKWTHILHQDDCLITHTAYNFLQESSEENDSWFLLTGSEPEKPFLVPRISKHLVFGFNTIGGPSALVVASRKFIPFSETLEMLVDVENFSNYLQRFGNPKIIQTPTIQYGNPISRASRSMSSETVVNELVQIMNQKDIPNKLIARTIYSNKLNPFQQILVLKAYRYARHAFILEVCLMYSILTMRRLLSHVK